MERLQWIWRPKPDPKKPPSYWERELRRGLSRRGDRSNDDNEEKYKTQSLPNAYFKESKANAYCNSFVNHYNDKQKTVGYAANCHHLNKRDIGDMLLSSLPRVFQPLKIEYIAAFVDARHNFDCDHFLM